MKTTPPEPRAPITMNGRLALPLLNGLRARGIEVDPILARIGLDAVSLRPLNARISMEAFLDLHAATVAATGDRTAPLLMANELDREAFPLAFHLMGTQATLRDGYRFVEPYRSTIVDRIEYALAERGDLAQIRFDVDGQPLGPPLFSEYLIVLVLALGRLLIPDSQPPTEVVFAHRWPRHTENLSDIVRCPVVYGGDAVAFVFPNPRLNLPIAGADPHLGEVLATSAASFLDPESSGERLRDRVRRFIAQRKLEKGEPTSAEIGKALRMSERTLRRHLELEGTSLRELLDDVRRERAVALLEEGRTSVDEISYRLGFSGANAFRRAFKRWTGTTPADYASSTGQVTGQGS